MKMRVGKSHTQKAAWEKLSKPEQKLIADMMNEESAKLVKENTEKTWQDLESSLVEAMRNNHISQDRVQRIIDSCNDIADRKHGIKLEQRDINKYVVLNRDEILDICELLTERCENCFDKPETCKLHKFLEARCLPVSDGYKMQVCKYSYGKKVV
jgi:hypothetical protein